MKKEGLGLEPGLGNLALFEDLGLVVVTRYPLLLCDPQMPPGTLALWEDPYTESRTALTGSK